MTLALSIRKIHRENKWEMQSGYVFRGILTIRASCIFQLYFLVLFHHWHQYYLHFNFLKWWRIEREKIHSRGNLCALPLSIGRAGSEPSLEMWSWGSTKLHPFQKWGTLIPLWRREEVDGGDALASKLLGTLHSAVSWAVTLMDAHIAFGFVPDVIYVATDLAFFLTSCFLPCALPLKN